MKPVVKDRPDVHQSNDAGTRKGNDQKGCDQKQYTGRDWLLLFGKGIAMGAADVVPGVSGGTIAFISGIYDRLLNALRSLTPMALVILYRQGLAVFWQAIDGRFLVTLFGGILLSILTLAKLISYALEHHPLLVWSFFFGLVLASILYLMMQTPRWRWQEVVAIGAGSLIALIIVSLRPAQLPAEWWMLFLAGAIAICAMILPGISGSFILLLMGMYPVFIGALEDFDLLLLISFACGCVTGLLGFSHLLSWLLRHYESLMYALLTGFLVGSLKVLWPWKQVLETTTDRHGELIPLVQANVLPFHYTGLTGEPALLLWSLLCALFGFALVLLLEKTGNPDG